MKKFIRENKIIVILLIFITILIIGFIIKIRGNNNNIIDKEDKSNNTQIKHTVEIENCMVEYKVPTGFTIKDDWVEFKKIYTNNHSILAHISINWSSEEDYISQNNSNYNFYKDSNYYDEVELSNVKNTTIGNKEFKYQTLICKSKNVKIQNMDIWYKIDEEYMFCVELEINNYNVELNDNVIDEIKEFLDITIKNI